MRTPPEKANGALARGAAAKVEKATFRDLPTTASAKRAQVLTVLGSIKKSNASQLRISISTWRDERKLELRECTRLFGETFFPAGAPLTIDLDRVPQFIALLSMAVRS
jgi:hypothetical protein